VLFVLFYYYGNVNSWVLFHNGDQAQAIWHNPGDPELMLVLLANIHFAKEQAWGHEFRAAMAAIRKLYNYDHVHDAASTQFILKELA